MVKRYRAAKYVKKLDEVGGAKTPLEYTHWVRSDETEAPHCAACGFYSDDAARGVARYCPWCGLLSLN